MKFGWGDCSHCGVDVGITKTGKAVRHGFFRLRRGYRRVNMPELASGHDHHSCLGSGKETRNTFFKNAVR